MCNVPGSFQLNFKACSRL